MVEPVKVQCSFCPRKACRIVSDDGGFFDCCATCERAWKANPSFLTQGEREELAGRPKQWS